MIRTLLTAIAAIFTLALGAMPAAAQPYTQANFSGGIFGGNANVKSPFIGSGLFPGMTFTGSFVFSNALIPASGSGFVNIYQANFADIANIPDADAFSFDFGPFSFNAGDNVDSLVNLGIQYNNGHFNGFVFNGDFAYQGAWYQLAIQGGSLKVRLLDGIANGFDPHGFPTGSNLVNGYINIGDANVTNQTPYTPQGGVPEPMTWAMLMLGVGIAGATMRHRRAIVRFA